MTKLASPDDASSSSAYEPLSEEVTYQSSSVTRPSTCQKPAHMYGSTTSRIWLSHGMHDSIV